MAAPGDPDRPTQPMSETRPAPEGGATRVDHSHDDLIGFTSASSLAGHPRSTRPEVSATPAGAEPASPANFDVEDDAATMRMDEDLFADSPETTPDPTAQDQTAPTASPPEQPPLPISGSEEPIFVPQPAPVASAPVEAQPAETRPGDISPVDTGPVEIAPVEVLPVWATETPRVQTAAKPAFGRADTPAAPLEGAMGLYTIYALILFAVPTLGVAALVALVAVIGRPAPQQGLALSHYVYQKRTLWIAAITAALGVVLIAVNLGVFVLFLLAVWMVIRGATGILRLSAGRPIARPNGWFF